MNRFILALTLAIVPAGCGVGSSSLLFATKTNAGLDVDSMPPTAQLSIGRSEGVIAPAFERGQTPPIIASFRTADEGVFATRVGSAFAAGGAAVALSRLWDSAANASNPCDFDSTLVLSEKPIPPIGETWPEKGTVRPLVFGTDTSLGVKAAWSAMGGVIPDSLRIGFHRKEIAWAPATYAASRPDGKGGVEQGHFVDVPSLLATVDVNVDAGTPADTRWQYVQYFATGHAATRLAMQPEVRAALRQRFDPGCDENHGITNPATDDSADRLRAWLASDDRNETKMRQWLDARGVANSVDSVINDPTMKPLRDHATTDATLAVPPPPALAADSY